MLKLLKAAYGREKVSLACKTYYPFLREEDANMVSLQGEKVKLKQASADDIEELYYWKYEEETQEAKKWNAPYTPEVKISKKEYQAIWEYDHEIYPGFPSMLIIYADGKLIGTVGAYWVDKNTEWLETGIVIYDKDYWNGGYGTEAYHLWIDFLFRTTNLHRLGMATWSGNARMIRIAEKAGMKEEARIREARKVDGKYFDAVKMGILRSEWETFKKEGNG